MNCPRCEEGVLVKIKFKKSGKNASVCDFCEALWFENEMIDKTTGHTLEVYTKENEHGFEEFNKQDQDHRPVKPVRKI